MASRWPPCSCKRLWGSRLTEKRLLWPSCPSYGKWPWVLVGYIHFLTVKIKADRVTSTVLNVEQFQKFMAVIKKLGNRVEREHDQFLRDSQRLEDRSTVSVSGAPASNPVGGVVNFENLVGHGDGVTVKPDTVINGSSKGWDEDDVWGSIFSSDEAVGIFFFPSRRIWCVLTFFRTPYRSPHQRYQLRQSCKQRLYHQLR